MPHGVARPLEGHHARIVEIRERAVPISRYTDSQPSPNGLTTSVVSVRLDVWRRGKPVVGYGFASVGRYGQGGLIRERFAPQLLAAARSAPHDSLSSNAAPPFDPSICWRQMMQGEKPGGHGERCVAVGTLDMAIWDAAAKLADLPLREYLVRHLGLRPVEGDRIRAYASGGYPHEASDLAKLDSEIRGAVDQGFSCFKIKVGDRELRDDLKRVEIACRALGSERCLAVDAMNRYAQDDGIGAARAFTAAGLMWFEDPCDPHAFEIQNLIASACGIPLAVGEALFSQAEARLLDLYGGLDRSKDILVFDPVHCYGLTGFLQVFDTLKAAGWAERSFWPHGGSLFAQHVVHALGLDGAELNLLAFAPFRGLAQGQDVVRGTINVPAAPGVGFETHPEMAPLFQALSS